MPTNVSPIELQNMQVGINGPDGANTLFISAGKAQIYANVSTAQQQQLQQSFSYFINLDPKLTRSQFVRSIAVCGISNVRLSHAGASTYWNANWAMGSVRSIWDDDTGNIQLLFDVSLFSANALNITTVEVAFQVMTLAQMPIQS